MGRQQEVDPALGDAPVEVVQVVRLAHHRGQGPAGLGRLPGDRPSLRRQIAAAMLIQSVAGAPEGGGPQQGLMLPELDGEWTRRVRFPAVHGQAPAPQPRLPLALRAQLVGKHLRRAGGTADARPVGGPGHHAQPLVLLQREAEHLPPLVAPVGGFALQRVAAEQARVVPGAGDSLAFHLLELPAHLVAVQLAGLPPPAVHRPVLRRRVGEVLPDPKMPASSGCLCINFHRIPCRGVTVLPKVSFAGLRVCHPLLLHAAAPYSTVAVRCRFSSSQSMR